jgi:hypothetical protein
MFSASERLTTLSEAIADLGDYEHDDQAKLSAICSSVRLQPVDLLRAKLTAESVRSRQHDLAIPAGAR